MTKTCTKCGEAKPLTEFYSCKGSKDGKTWWCKACMLAARAAHRRANPEKTAAYNAQWRRDNPDYESEWQHANRDKVNTKAAKYRRANPEKVAAAQAEWRRENPEYWAEYSRANPHVGWETSYRIRCAKLGLEPVDVEPFTRDDVIAQYGDACSRCGDGGFEELDHHIPIAAHGPHTLDNVRPSCEACNRRKVHTADRVLINVYRAVAAAIAAFWEEEQQAS